MLSSRNIFILIACLLLVACGGPEEKKEIIKPVKTITIGKMEQGISRNYPGVVLAVNEADLAFQVSGEILEFPVLQGQDVIKDEVLAKIDPLTYQDKVTEAAANFKLADAQFGRAKQLIESGHISKMNYDRLESNFNVSKANLNIAERNLGYTVLKAPFDGKIAKTFSEKFEFVKEKQKIIRLQDVSEIDVAINVPEQIVLNVEQVEGKRKGTVTFESAPNKSYESTIKEFSSEADPKTQTYRVVFTLPAPEDINVLPGMTASVALDLIMKTEVKKNYYLIPSSAVFVNEGKTPHVWFLDQETMTLTSKAIVVGDLSGKNIQVFEGIHANDIIVSAGVHYLREGQKVSIAKSSEQH